MEVCIYNNENMMEINTDKNDENEIQTGRIKHFAYSALLLVRYPNLSSTNILFEKDLKNCQIKDL